MKKLTIISQRVCKLRGWDIPDRLFIDNNLILITADRNFDCTVWSGCGPGRIWIIVIVSVNSITRIRCLHNWGFCSRSHDLSVPVLLIKTCLSCPSSKRFVAKSWLIVGKKDTTVANLDLASREDWLHCKIYRDSDSFSRCDIANIQVEARILVCSLQGIVGSRTGTCTFRYIGCCTAIDDLEIMEAKIWEIGCWCNCIPESCFIGILCLRVAKVVRNFQVLQRPCIVFVCCNCDCIGDCNCTVTVFNDITGSFSHCCTGMWRKWRWGRIVLIASWIWRSSIRDCTVICWSIANIIGRQFNLIVQDSDFIGSHISNCPSHGAWIRSGFIYRELHTAISCWTAVWNDFFIDGSTCISFQIHCGRSDANIGIHKACVAGEMIFYSNIRHCCIPCCHCQCIGEIAIAFCIRWINRSGFLQWQIRWFCVWICIEVDCNIQIS